LDLNPSRTTKFLNKSFAEKGESYDEVKQNFSTVSAGKIMSRSGFKKRKARNVVMKTVLIGIYDVLLL